MSRFARALVGATAVTLWLPRVALADGRFSEASLGAHIGLSLVGLVVAVVLLIQALGVRKLALGGAVAERIGLVVLAVICLAGSALAEWGTNFVGDLTLEQTQLASEILVIAAMGLLAAYFYSVRSVMKRYLSGATADTAEQVEPETVEEVDRG
jgi:amino acid transporter